MKDTKSDPVVPIVGFAGFSGSGKTTLLKKLIPLFKKKGLRVAVLKHAHHNFDVDVPGKDSYEVRQAGAQQVLVASKRRWALMVETPEQGSDPALNELLGYIDRSCVDLILVEGFKSGAHRKIEINRSESAGDFLYLSDDNIVAIATDEPGELNTDLPQLDINDVEAIVDFILTQDWNMSGDDSGGRR